MLTDPALPFPKMRICPSAPAGPTPPVGPAGPVGPGGPCWPTGPSGPAGPTAPWQASSAAAAIAAVAVATKFRRCMWWSPSRMKGPTVDKAAGAPPVSEWAELALPLAPVVRHTLPEILDVRHQLLGVPAFLRVRAGRGAAHH